MVSKSRRLILSVWVLMLGSWQADVRGQFGVPFSNYAQMRERLVRDVLVPGGVQDQRVLPGRFQAPTQQE